ncbi:MULTISPECIES: hypothetical protein [Enterobacteriaceae]|nr:MULTISPECIES: hypothetical protein [Enterobacteriaceae]MBS0854369.1 hypothetical protein [Enterobacter sp. JGM127]HDN4608821.1 hypothetical protein [Salmonella enterica subsp. enterica serovar Agona]MCW4859850.1 hypothetical protein [Enterobacter mori]MDM3373560.1 hypothetical protein [Citrobacter sp. Cb010]MDM3456781.1 hypothetical protein [Citrobacter sp. Cb036]
MGVRRDSDGKYVTSGQPFKQYDEKWRADNAASWEGPTSQPNQPVNNSWESIHQHTSASTSMSYEDRLAFANAARKVLALIVIWFTLWGVILMPGLQASQMLIYGGGLNSIPGRLIFSILYIVYAILFAPLQFAYLFDVGDLVTRSLIQLGVVVVLSFLVVKFWQKLRKKLLYSFVFIAVLAYIAVGLVSLNSEIWESFKFFPYLS